MWTFLSMPKRKKQTFLMDVKPLSVVKLCSARFHFPSSISLSLSLHLSANIVLVVYAGLIGCLAFMNNVEHLTCSVKMVNISFTFHWESLNGILILDSICHRTVSDVSHQCFVMGFNFPFRCKWNGSGVSTHCLWYVNDFRIHMFDVFLCIRYGYLVHGASQK